MILPKDRGSYVWAYLSGSCIFGVTVHITLNILKGPMHREALPLDLDLIDCMLILYKYPILEDSQQVSPNPILFRDCSLKCFTWDVYGFLQESSARFFIIHQSLHQQVFYTFPMLTEGESSYYPEPRRIL